MIRIYHKNPPFHTDSRHVKNMAYHILLDQNHQNPRPSVVSNTCTSAKDKKSSGIILNTNLTITDLNLKKQTKLPELKPSNVIFRCNEALLYQWYIHVLGIEESQVILLFNNENKLGLKRMSDLIKYEGINSIRTVNSSITVSTELRLKGFRDAVGAGNSKQITQYLQREKKYGMNHLSCYYSSDSISGNLDNLLFSSIGKRSPDRSISRTQASSTCLNSNPIPMHRHPITPIRSNLNLSRRPQGFLTSLPSNVVQNQVQLRHPGCSTPLNSNSKAQNQIAENNDVNDLEESVSRMNVSENNKDLPRLEVSNDTILKPVKCKKVVDKQQLKKMLKASEARMVEPNTTCKTGSCHGGNCFAVTKQQRENVFDNYWSLLDQEEQQRYIIENLVRFKEFHIEEITVCWQFISATIGHIPSTNSSTNTKKAVGEAKLKKLRDQGYLAVATRGGKNPDANKLSGVKAYVENCKKFESHWGRTKLKRTIIRVAKGFTQNMQGNCDAYAKFCQDNDFDSYDSRHFKDVWSKYYERTYTLTFDRSSHCEICTTYDNTNPRTPEQEKAQAEHKRLCKLNKEQRISFLQDHDKKIISMDMQKSLSLYDNVKCEGKDLNFLGIRPVYSNNTFCQQQYVETSTTFEPSEFNPQKYSGVCMTYTTPFRRTGIMNANTLIEYLKIKKLTGKLLFEADNCSAQSKCYEFWWEVFSFINSKDAENLKIESIICHYLEPGHSFMTSDKGNLLKHF